MKKLIHEVLHFGVIGVFNTLLGLVLTMSFYNLLHWNYWVASASSYTIGSIFSYFLNKKLTFKAQGNDRKYILRFAINVIICYLLAYGIAKPVMISLLDGYSQQIVENVAMIFGMGLFIGFNFLGQKFLVFREKETGEGKGC